MFKLVRWGQKYGLYNHAEFVCDSEADMSDIDLSPCAPGSVIFCVAEQTHYILNASRELKQYTPSGSGSGTSAPVATIDETEDYLGI